MSRDRTTPSVAARYVVSNLMGAPSRILWRLLRDNGFDVDAPYILRVFLALLVSPFNEIAAWSAARRVVVSSGETDASAPLLVLGQWRSGTSHLHELLRQDPAFAAPNLAQVMFPYGSATLERVLNRVLPAVLPATRQIDAMRLDAFTAQEDEFALAVMTGMSPYLAYVFPRRWRFYDRYITFDNTSVDERCRWQRAMRAFAGDVSRRTGRRPVLKSPAHTARIPLLLTAFPNARFVHISREPRTVFRSTRSMLAIGGPLSQLQRFDFGTVDDHIIRRYRQIGERYLATRDQIPTGRLAEVSYEALTANPLDTMTDIYRQLGLPFNADTQRRLTEYLNGIEGYQTTAHDDPSLESEKQFLLECGHLFEPFGYPAPCATNSR